MEYFKEQFCIDSRKQKNKYLTIYLIVVALYLIASIIILVEFIRLPYGSPKISTIKWIQHSISAVFIIFSFLFLGIPYKRASKYYKLSLEILFGRKETSEGAFYKYDNTLQYNQGVDFTTLVFVEWNQSKKDYFERKVLVFTDQPLPEFAENDIVEYVTHSNILVSYKILSKATDEDNSEEPTDNQTDTTTEDSASTDN